MLNQRKGWIKVVEAFFAILIIGGVILIVVSQDSDNNEDISTNVYGDELAILRAVQLNDSLRNSVLGINDGSLPLELTDAAFPSNVEAKINEKIPSYLTCGVKICAVEQRCLPDYSSVADTYTSQVTIFANLTKNNPRKLVISCGLK